MHKRFGSTHVIRGVDIDIADGEFCVLVGPSGCGKSTLLRMIAGLEEITRGRDRDRRAGSSIAMPPKERDIAMVFQNYALYPHMTVRDNMSFALMLAKQPKAEIEAAGAEGRRHPRASSRISIAIRASSRAASGSASRWAARSSAIPQVFLFDEPLSNLDAKLRVQMRTEIKELHQRLKTTSIYVTHDQIEAMTMADKIVVMRDGVVEQTGDPLDALRPSRQHVRRRLHRLAGDEHDSRERARDRRRRARSNSRRRRDVAAAATAPAPTTASRCSTASVPSTSRSAATGMPVDVVVVEPTGADTQLYCRFNGQEVTATIRDRADCHPGDRIHLAPDLARAHLFDAASGKRLVA